jgi:hypothetical protein
MPEFVADADKAFMLNAWDNANRLSALLTIWTSKPSPASPPRCFRFAG